MKIIGNTPQVAAGMNQYRLKILGFPKGICSPLAKGGG